jgi:hypothetical protein
LYNQVKTISVRKNKIELGHSSVGFIGLLQVDQSIHKCDLFLELALIEQNIRMHTHQSTKWIYCTEPVSNDANTRYGSAF